MSCSTGQRLLPLLQSSYTDRDRAPALSPERCSQQLANVNLPDMHSRVERGASKTAAIFHRMRMSLESNLLV